MRYNGAVLLARKGDEYWFLDSIFKHDDDFSGSTGCVVFPVTADQVAFDCEPDQLVERYIDFWEEYTKKHIDSDCRCCRFGPDEDGCEDCGYKSARDYCQQDVNELGWKTLYDDPGPEYLKAFRGRVEVAVEVLDCVSCGRIFGKVVPSDFDEVYNIRALMAAMAYDDGAVSYDYAQKVCYGD